MESVILTSPLTSSPVIAKDTLTFNISILLALILMFGLLGVLARRLQLLSRIGGVNQSNPGGPPNEKGKTDCSIVLISAGLCQLHFRQLRRETFSEDRGDFQHPREGVLFRCAGKEHRRNAVAGGQ